MDARDFAAVVELNLLAGCILPTKHVAQYSIAQGIRGAIINIASMGSYRPLSGGWAYSAAKAAVMNQTVAHARNWRPTGSGSTPWPPGSSLASRTAGSWWRRRHADRSRPGRPGPHAAGPLRQPDELIGAAVFLASDGAGFVSGVTLPVDGAFLCHGI